MKIGLFTSVYFNNIGNGFIDLGAEATIKAAMPRDAEIVKLSQCANFAASMGRSFALKESPIINWLWVRFMQKFAKKLHDRSYSAVSTLDVFSPAKIAKLDYLVLPGCILTVPFFVIFGKLLEDKVAQGCKLIFLAASGNHYTKKEVEVVSAWLEKLKPHAIMTRDSVAYKHYAKYSRNSYNGIDNVFFVNRLDIKKVNTTIDPYIVLNFDEPRHKKIRQELEKKFIKQHIVYTDHKPYPYSKVSRLSKQNILFRRCHLEIQLNCIRIVRESHCLIMWA